MSTAEDVFYLYERNSSFYHKCANLDNCPTKIGKTCYCDDKQIVKPNIIGDTCSPCNIKRLCYVKPGSECSICMETIDKKSETYITQCGHGFHKKCIFRAFVTKWNKKYASVFRCPNCRINLNGRNLRYCHSIRLSFVKHLIGATNFL